MENKEIKVDYKTASTVRCVNLLYLYNATTGSHLTADTAVTTPDFIRFAAYMMALYADINSDFFAESDRILFYHTGGLQGIRGYPEWDKAFKDLGFSAFSGL